MSLVTRCPSCETTFKVVRDQLRISDGWVRCGRCSQVFDATLDLRETPDTVVATPTTSHPAVEAQEDPLIEIDLPIDMLEMPRATELPAAPQQSPSRVEHEALPAAHAAPTAEQALALASVEEEEPQPVASPAPPPPVWPAFGMISDEPWLVPAVEDPASPNAAQAAVPADPPESMVPAGAEPAPVLAQGSLASSMEALDDFAAFVDQSTSAQPPRALRRVRLEAVRDARARRAAEAAREEDAAASPVLPPREDAPGMPLASPMITAASAIDAPSEAASGLPSFAQPLAPGRRFGEPVRRGNRLVLLAIVLVAMLLGLQWLRHERDILVARQPSLRPILQALCNATGCELSAVRQIGSITIDGAAFARDKVGEGYRLDFTLRNGVAMPLAMPAVELSLLDTQERPVVRRVLLPADFDAPAVLQARSERAASLALVLTGPEATALPAIAGYRVVAFYP